MKVNNDDDVTMTITIIITITIMTMIMTITITIMRMRMRMRILIVIIMIMIIIDYMWSRLFNPESFRVLTLEIRNTSLVLRCFAVFVLCIRSMLLWSIKGHDGNVSASSYLLL